MPTVDCDLDHRRPWADGGPTTERNLAPLCRSMFFNPSYFISRKPGQRTLSHNHGAKHRCGWTYQQLPNGDYLSTSRLGHTYTTSGHPP